MKLIVHRGIGQIGGTCLEIATGTTRLILDCGWPLEGATEQGPPAVPGLFAPGKPPDAVFLSHAHPDHTGFIAQIPSSVPIYATAGTSKMMLAGSIYAGGIEIPRERFREMPVPKPREASRSFPIGDLRVTALPVDHSAFGAVACLVEHGGRRILYTGDLRFHGRKPGMSRRLLRELSGKLDLLITEGTNLGRSDTGLRTEAEVEDRASEVARSSRSLVLAAFSPQNIDRFVSFFRAAMRAGRAFVGDHYLLAVLHFIQVSRLGPGVTRDLRFYFPEKRKRIPKIERLAGARTITRTEILAEPHRYLMLVRPSILRDFAGALPGKTQLLYGMWSGYRERAEWVEAERALAAVAGKTFRCHASGHSSAADLFTFIRKIDPARVLPVHTTAPAQFARFLPDSYLAPQTMIDLPRASCDITHAMNPDDDKIALRYSQLLKEALQLKHSVQSAKGAHALLENLLATSGALPSGVMKMAYRFLEEEWRANSRGRIGDGISSETPNWQFRPNHETGSKELHVEVKIRKALGADQPCGNAVAASSGLFAPKAGNRQIDLVRLLTSSEGEFIELKLWRAPASKRALTPLGVQVRAAFQIAQYGLIANLWHANAEEIGLLASHAFLEKRPILKCDKLLLKTTVNRGCYNSGCRELKSGQSVEIALGKLSDWLTDELNAVADEHESKILNRPIRFRHSFHIYPDDWAEVTSSVTPKEAKEVFARVS